MQAGMDAVLLRAREDGVERLDHDRVGLVELRLAAHRQAEVGRANIDAVEARRAHDRVEVLYRLGGLDHGDGEHRLVRRLWVEAGGALERVEVGKGSVKERGWTDGEILWEAGTN